MSLKTRQHIMTAIIFVELILITTKSIQNMYNHPDIDVIFGHVLGLGIIYARVSLEAVDPQTLVYPYAVDLAKLMLIPIYLAYAIFYMGCVAPLL